MTGVQTCALPISLRGSAASLGAALRVGAASLGATLRVGAGSLGATLRGGVASMGAVLLLGRRGAIPSTSHDDGAVLLLGWGASVSCGGARVLASHARWVEVAVVMGVAVGAGAGVARSAGWGSRGSSCGVESPLASWAESWRVTSGDPGALRRVIVGDSAAP